MLSEERGIATKTGVYPPGTSPFHVRGGAYRNALDHAERHVPGGIDRLKDACPDPGLKTFLSQKFEPSGWYDVLPIAPLSDVMAELLGVTLEQYLLDRTREHAHRDLVGLYRLLLRAVSARTVALFLPKLTARYYDWGGIDARLRGPRHVETVRRGVPEPLARWYSMVACSFAEAALEIAGAPHPRIVVSSSEPDGAAFGVATREFVFDVTWGA
jgi:hypothetical protein